MSAIVTLLVAVFVASAGASTGAAKYPPCTKKALSAGLKRGTAQPKNVSVQFPGPWAARAGKGSPRLWAMSSSLR